MDQIGRPLILIGLVLVVIGLLFVFGERLPFRLGRLPLDFHYQRDGLSVYVPLGTSILLSVLLTLIFTLAGRR